MSTERIGTVQSAVNELIRVLTKCTDIQFGERISIIFQLCQIWSNGEDVDLRCNEPEIASTNEVVKSGQFCNLITPKGYLYSFVKIASCSIT